MSSTDLTNSNPQFEVHFEPGMHALDEYDWGKIQQGLSDGNPNSNDWNEAVTDRVREYEPSVISLDGLFFNGDKSTDYSIERKVGLWAIMPDRPSRLNGTDSIYVLGGDNTYGGKYKNGEWDSGVKEVLVESGSFAAIIMTASVLGTLGDEAYYGWKRWQKGYDPYAGVFDEEKAAQVSRRSFLRYLALGSAVLTFRGSVLPSALAAYSPWGPVSDVAKAFVEETEFLQLSRRFGQRTYADGRTALLIAKTFDTLNNKDVNLANGRGAVVMGNGHIPFSSEYLEDEDTRADAMHRHTEALLQEALTVPYFNDEHKHKVTVTDRQQAVLEAERKYVLFEVKEPDDKRFRKDPKKEIDRIVQFHGTYTAPSVVAATSDLKAA